MQPYTAEFAKANLTPQPEAIVIGSYEYRAHIEEDEGWIAEKGPQSSKQ